MNVPQFAERLRGPPSSKRLTALHGRTLSVDATIRAMPLGLSDAELATAATACRAMSYQEGERAKKMQNPTTGGPIENAAQRYAALADKLEAARRNPRT